MSQGVHFFISNFRLLRLTLSLNPSSFDFLGSSTLQKTEAKVVSKLGWLARRVERYGHEKFQRNLERVCTNFLAPP